MTEEKKVEQAPETKTAATITEDKPEVQLSEAAGSVVKTIEEMSVLELSKLVTALEDKFGVSASMPAMAIGGVPGAAVAEEEKTVFTVELVKVGAQKIQVIKEIRTITSLGLKEAKDLVDSAPKTVKEDATKEEAEEIKKKLEAVGASVELK